MRWIVTRAWAAPGSNPPANSMRVAQGLVRPQLVDRRALHLAGDLGQAAVHRHEHHVAGLEP